MLGYVIIHYLLDLIIKQSNNKFNNLTTTKIIGLLNLMVTVMLTCNNTLLLI